MPVDTEYKTVGWDNAQAKGTEMLKAKNYANSELQALVEDNMEKRAKHLLPDVWFWADVELLNRGILNRGMTGNKEWID